MENKCNPGEHCYCITIPSKEVIIKIREYIGGEHIYGVNPEHLECCNCGHKIKK